MSPATTRPEIEEISKRIYDRIQKLGLKIDLADVKVRYHFESDSYLFWVEKADLNTKHDCIGIPQTHFEDRVQIVDIEIRAGVWVGEYVGKVYESLTPGQRKFLALFCGRLPNSAFPVSEMGLWLGPEFNLGRIHKEMMDLGAAGPYANNIGLIHLAKFGNLLAERTDHFQVERFRKELELRLSAKDGYRSKGEL